MGWRGLLIEGSPTSYKNLVINRPYDLRVHAAVCETAGVVHWMQGPTPAVFGIYEFMNPRFKSVWNFHSPQGGQAINCLPMGDILKHLKIRHIDFFSLDVEGGKSSCV